MGLDQFIFKTSNVNDNDAPTQYVAYWRKENALQGWFERNFDLENCGKVELTSEVIDSLLIDLKNRALEPTSGFFYGSLDPLDDEWYDQMYKEWEDIKKQVENSNLTFYYTCWY